MFRSYLAAAVVGVAALVCAGPATTVAQPAARVEVGKLECSLSASIGLIVGSQKNVACNFKPDGGPPEAYTGTMTTLGLDVGVTVGGVMVWGVFTNTDRYTGMLAGTYVGGTAEMTVAAGLGANVLVGGSNRAVALQPLSVQGQLGLNIAAGIGALELHYAQ
jgi:Protein of unknown function (DUF992)